MQPNLFQKPRRDTEARGQMRAIQAGSKLSTEISNVILEYRQLNSPEARGVFADEWLRMMANGLERIWGPFYELMNLVKTDKLYANPEHMNGREYASFGEFWKDVTARSLQEWADLESTYHYISENCPELMSKIGFEQAKEIRLGNNSGPLPGSMTLAKRPGREIRANGAPVDSDGINKCTLRGGNNALYLLARLRRDRPDLVERFEAGEFPSVRAAALEAGIVQPSFQCPADPLKASRRLLRHFDGDRLLTLLAELASHAGYDLTPRE